MSDPGLLPPPPPPLSSADATVSGGELVRPSRHFRAVAVTAAAVVVAVAAAGGILALRAFQGSADSVVAMVPSDTALYVNVNFDPPGGQKLAVEGLLNKFPALDDQSRSATLNGWLDTALSSAGMNHNDVTPWLGSELSIAMPAPAMSSLIPKVSGGAPVAPDVAVLIASKDDGNAQAALDKLRNGPASAAERWTTSSYDGVTVTAGTGHGSGGAYAITNHTVVLASTVREVDAVIDTAQGKRTNLQSSTGYTTVESQLPADRLGLIYVDVPAFVQGLGASIDSVPGAKAQLSALRAYGGFGVALVASSDGVALEGTENYDASKLTPEQRAQLGTAPHANGSLGFVPKTALGVLAFTGVQQTLDSVLTTVAPAGSAIATTLRQFGVTGSGGIIGHLSGDAGVEVDQVAGQPAGALLFNTDSTSAAQSFLDNLVSSLCGKSTVCDAAQITRQADKGVTISSVPLAGGAGGGVQPSWAVSNGWAIIGSSPAEVRAALDSHASGSNITTSPSYSAVASHVGSSSNSMFYIDIPSVVQAIRKVLPPDAQASFDHSAAPYLNHLGAMGLSARNATDRATFSFFLQVR